MTEQAAASGYHVRVSELPADERPRERLERLDLPNDFRAFERRTGKKLYISACDLDTAERAIFGSDENCEVTISQAVQASSALPLFYRPARINGIDYIDGGVRNTANIDIDLALLPTALPFGSMRKARPANTSLTAAICQIAVWWSS